MKKSTLSAAILAMTMMGCSDVGLDNSVASTSNAQNKLDLSFFNEPTEFKDVASSENALVLRKSGDELSGGVTVYDDNNKYRIDISSYVFDKTHGNVSGGSVLILARQTAPGVYYCQSDSDQWCWYYGANYAHLYVACVRNCDGFGNCREHDEKGLHWPVSPRGTVVPYINYECKMEGDNSDVGVVTYGAAVFENGTVAIQGATKENLSNDMALLVYRNYILPMQLKHAGL